ncbi:MAG: N-acetylglucosamine-6-phosphate deacetylase [Clostridia bacterium]|nr:N-acetylglucosamine-6-phosphate deacetylase [Clostridia bacterium]
MIIRIKNAVIVSSFLLKGRYIYIEDGKISKVTEENLPFDEEIDAEGLYVSSGFIDIHTHGAGGFDYADGDKDAVRKAAYVSAKHGATTIYPTCTSSSFTDTLKFIENVKEVMAENAPGKPNIAGSHLEGPYFSHSMCGAQNPAYIKNPDRAEYEEFYKKGCGTLRRISFAPELKGSRELNSFLKEKGITSSFAHTDAVYEELKPLIDEGCTLATHLYSGMNQVTRRNLSRKLGAVDTSYLEDAVFVEVIADGIHLPKELLSLIYKIKGQRRMCLITDSMRGAGMPEGEYILGRKDDGLLTVSDGSVAYLTDKSAYAGSVATCDRLLRVAVKEADIPLCSAVRMLTVNPARVMNLQNRGEIKEEYYADLVFFDEGINIKKVIIEGKELD